MYIEYGQASRGVEGGNTGDGGYDGGKGGYEGGNGGCDAMHIPLGPRIQRLFFSSYAQG